jgi:hypothetical protein
VEHQIKEPSPEPVVLVTLAVLDILAADTRMEQVAVALAAPAELYYHILVIFKVAETVVLDYHLI